LRAEAEAEVLAGRVNCVDRVVAGVGVAIALAEVGEVAEWVALCPAAQAGVVVALPEVVEPVRVLVAAGVPERVGGGGAAADW
jgi:hypothetical protein